MVVKEILSDHQEQSTNRDTLCDACVFCVKEEWKKQMQNPQRRARVVPTTVGHSGF